TLVRDFRVQTLVRDFLVQIKEFNCDQWSESTFSLQLENQAKETSKKAVELERMQQVPGLMPVNQREEVEMA
ncbi:hypothetical protein T484DRAFT_1839146, partial [Baffinella frigidus]